jgi:hypothetical protein
MSPGMRVKLSPDAAAFYRKPATSLEGTVVGLSRSGNVARVHLDDVADTYIRTADLTPIKR